MRMLIRRLGTCCPRAPFFCPQERGRPIGAVKVAGTALVLTALAMTRIGPSGTRGQTCRYWGTGQRSVSADRVGEIWYRRRRDRGALEEPDHVDRDRGATRSGRFEADVGSKP